MKNIIYLPLTLLFIGLAGLTFAQDAASKKVQAGLTFNAGANFLTPGTTKITTDGAGSLLSIGVAINSGFKSSENLGIATGLDFDFGKNNYSPNNLTYIDYIEGEVLTQAHSEDNYSTMRLDKRDLKTIKLSIPVMLLFRTNYIGDFRYFGKFGLRNSFLLSQKFTDNGTDVFGVENVENTLMSSPGEFFVYNGSVGLSAGAEWNFVGSTCLVLEAGYYYGITPYFLDRKDENKTMYNITSILVSPPERSYYSASARQNQLIFKLSVLF
jgi:hypothetical protein